MSGLAEVRAAHGWQRTAIRTGPAMQCSCGEWVDDHRAHVDAALLAWLGERLAGVRDDVARAILVDDIAKGRAADEWNDGADRQWLRDNADIALAVVAEALGIDADHNPREEADKGARAGERVHDHPPYRPVCNERLVDGQLRGACLNDDGTARPESTATSEEL